MTDEELLEKNWGPALVHESGHALMALLKDIHCRGIFYDKTANKFCAITDLPSESEYSNDHYLFLTASSAAETVIYGKPDEDGAKSDRAAFKNTGAPSLEATQSAAQTLILENEAKLKQMVSKLKAKCLQVDLNLGALPEVRMDGSDHKFGVLMSRAELEDTLQT